jgi:hypothetical protein
MPGYGPKVYRKQGGDELVVASGGAITAESGSTVDLSGSTLTLPAALVLPAALDLDSTTGTFSSNAVTITKRAAQLTTESLTTAHTASQALVVTLAGVAATDLPIITRAGGTNTGGVPNITSVVCTTNTVTINLKNEALATNAFNGTFIFNLIVFKA